MIRENEILHDLEAEGLRIKVYNVGPFETQCIICDRFY